MVPVRKDDMAEVPVSGDGVLWFARISCEEGCGGRNDICVFLVKGDGEQRRAEYRRDCTSKEKRRLRKRGSSTVCKTTAGEVCHLIERV